MSKSIGNTILALLQSKDFGALLITLILVVGVLLIPPSIHPNTHYFENYPVDVTVLVEEPLPVATIEVLSRMAFESLNRTFGYDINLKEISTFGNDSIQEYSKESLKKALWNSPFGGDKTLYWSITGGRVQMKVKCFYGAGPERVYYGEEYRVAGLSRHGSRIGLFFNSSRDLTAEGFRDNFETYLHEFGHAFGLEHQLYSRIMYSPEVDPPPMQGRPQTTFYRPIFDSGVVSPHPNGTMGEIMNESLAEFNGTISYFMPLKPMEWFNLTNPLCTTDTTPPIIGYVNQSYILCLEDSCLFTVLWVSSSLEDTPEGYYWHRWRVEGCVVSVEGDW